MRSVIDEMDNDPSASRSYDRDPTDELEDELHELEDYAANFFDEENIEADLQTQEFSALNQQLDQLQSALDMLESRNADIHQELLQLLQSNREVRRCLTEEMALAGGSSVPNTDEMNTEAVVGASSSSNSPVEPVEASSSVAAEVSLIESIETIKLEKCGSAN